MPLKDLTGQKFGRLTILKRDENRPKGSGKPVYWICQCDCGNIKSIRGNHIKSGATQSCGCLQKEKARAASIKDLTGQRFGRLTVINQDIRVKGHEAYWNCLCDCGNEVVVSGYQLRSGRCKSCGCYREENRMMNHMIDKTNKKIGKLTILKLDEKTTKKEGKLYWLCKCDCGNYCSIASRLLTNGHRKSCGCIRSLGENKINDILINNNYDFKREYTFEDLKDKGRLRFDFAIFKNKELYCLIEYQGRQHYLQEELGYHDTEDLKDIKKRDKMKKEYCEKNHIKLVEIPYWELDSIDENYLKEKIYGNNN